MGVATVSIAAIAVMLVMKTGADPDLWGHLRFGADLLASGRLTAHDPYSFTSDVAWVNHEWLSELLFAAFYAVGGAVGINLLKASIVASVAALLWGAVRRAGASDFSAVLLTALVVVVTSTRTQPIRPQLLSILFFTLLIAIGDAIERGRPRAAWAIPVLFCAWANAHGGWIVGFGVLAVWAVLTRRVGLIVAAAAGTLVNPYGIGLWTFVHDTVGLARPDIADWMPIYKLPLLMVVVECTLPALAVAAVWYTRRVPPLRHLAILGILTFGTVRISRIDAFLQIAIAMICAPALADAANAVDARLRRSGGLTRPSFASALAAAAMVIVTTGFSLFYAGRIVVDGAWVPDGEALHFIKGHMAHTRLLTWFDWGEYAIWHLSPNDIQVSMDGRRETVYSDRMVRDHFAFYGNEDAESWRYPDRIGADRVWLPKHLPVIAALRAHGWHPVFESPVSVVLIRDVDANQIARLTTTRRLGRSVFPGP